MCGIVGARHEWLLRRGLDPQRAMRDAVERQRWRGPDGAHVVRIGGWWLGCARLAITQPHSRQPVVRRGGRFAGVLNGAITNARELWALLLPGADRRAAPPNDAWLPLLAVAAGDRELLARLRGHHAYAVVDAATDEVVFGQDRFGEKPLWCLVDGPAATPALVAFASTWPALEALGAPPPEPGAALGDLLRTGFADFVAGAVRAPGAGPGPRVVAIPRRGEPLVAPAGREWAGPWRPAAAAVRRAEPPAQHTLRGRLLAGIARCTDTTQPVGLLLSGGVDSSCLAAGLRAVCRPAPAFQFQARGADPGERAMARSVAAHCGLPFHAVDGGPEVLDALPRLTALAGVPLGDPSVLAVHATARAAAAHGVRILLGGEGADELFLGYRRYRALAALPRLPFLRAFAPRWSMRYAARWLRAATAADPAAALLEVTPPAFREAVLATPPAAPGRPAGDAPADPVLAARDADVRGYLRLDLLPKVDVATMAAGLESRCPWLEGDFAEFGSTRAALGKRPLREAFAADLPAAVFRLPKRGFGLPLDRWFRGDLPLLDLLAEPGTRSRPHLRPGGLAEVVDRHRRGAADLGHGLYLLAAVELFLRCRERTGISA